MAEKEVIPQERRYDTRFAVDCMDSHRGGVAAALRICLSDESKWRTLQQITGSFWDRKEVADIAEQFETVLYREKALALLRTTL